MTYKRLFEAGKIGKLELKNRVIMAPMVVGFTNVDGSMSRQEADYFIERAKGGVGLIVVECTSVESHFEWYSPWNMPRLDDIQYIAGLAELVDDVHFHGSKIAIQLNFGLGAMFMPLEQLIPGFAPLSPSEIALPGVKPHVLTTEEVDQMVKSFGEAAARARMARFDAIHILGCAGYLLPLFMSPVSNNRTDKYGDLTMLPRELVKSVKEMAGDDFPIIFKFSADEFYEGGRKIEGSKKLAKVMEEAGVDAIDCSGSSYFSPEAQCWLSPWMSRPSGTFVPFAEELKKVVKIPVLLSGKLSDPALAEKVLEEGKADFIVLGRGLLADPEWTNKVATGRTEDIRPCMYCSDGCLGELMDGRKSRCNVNPMLRKEKEWELQPAKDRKRVIVIGGGPGGMEAARVAALRGYEVTLYEKENTLGGHLKEASVPEHKRDIKPLIKWLSLQIEKAGVKIEMNKEATADLVVNAKPDVVIVATGSDALIPDTPGVKKPKVVTAIDVLLEKVTTGNEVVVVGGSLVGADVAVFLVDRGKKVTIIEMLAGICLDLAADYIRPVMMELLVEKGVKWLTNTRLEEVTDEGIIAVSTTGEKQSIKADTVVLAVGLKPKKELFQALKDKVKATYVIGDASEPRKIGDAIREGFFIANKI